MSQELYRRVKQVFLTAVRRPIEDRTEFVREACGDDAELRREVEALLDFLEEGSNGPDAVPVELAGSREMPESIPGFRIERPLGEGGMGVVYEAEQEEPIRRRVALKIIRTGLGSHEIVARFESERQALAMMSHPSIAQVYAAGSSVAGRPFFAMEYVDGPTITEYCDRYRLDLGARLELFLAVCGGVQHAHEKGIIHRDVKPSNVLVATVDGRPLPKLIDFGIAKAIEQPLAEQALLTQVGQSIGTPEYMSPEQAGLRSGEIDARTDIYSLGVLLYELLVGVLPFAPEALREVGYEEMRRIIREEPPPRPSTRFPEVAALEEEIAATRGLDGPGLRRALAGDLDWIVIKALEKSPARRYGSVSELAADIERYLGNQPVEARAPTVFYRLAKLARRRRRPLATVLLVVIALLAGFAGTRLWWRVDGQDPVLGGTGSEAASLVDRGQQLLRQGSDSAVGSAVELFEQAIELEPDLAPAYAALAECYILQSRGGDLPMEEADRRAGEALEQALAIDDELAAAHATYGLLQSKLGDLAAAETSLRRAIELDPDLAIAHLRLANVLVMANRPTEAETTFERALALDPLDLRILDAVASALMRQGRYEEAMRQFERRLRIEPDSAETYRLMALFARTYGKLDDAVRWARKTVELEPDGVLNLNELAMAYSIIGDFAAASRWRKTAYARAPNNHWAITLEAILLVELGDFETLESFTREQLERHPPPETGVLPQIARLRLSLAGMAKIYRGEYAAGVDLLERAVGDSWAEILEPGFDASAIAFLAWAYQCLGREAEAAVATRKSLELIESRSDWIWARLIMPDDLAAVRVLEGRDDEAAEILIEAYGRGWMDYASLRYTPHFEALRRRDDLRRLMRQMRERRDALRRSLGVRAAGHQTTS